MKMKVCQYDQGSEAVVKIHNLVYFDQKVSGLNPDFAVYHSGKLPAELLVFNPLTDSTRFKV